MTNDQRPITNDKSLIQRVGHAASPPVISASAMSAVDHNLAEALINSGWSPIDEPVSASRQQRKEGDDLLPTLRDEAQRWVARATKASELRQAQQLVRLHEWLAATGAKLTFGWPGNSNHSLVPWIGTSLIWWPHGVPVGRKVVWVSSRLGRAIDERSDWFAVLRSAAAKLDLEQDVLLTSSSTTTGRFLERAAILFGLRLLHIHTETTRSLSDWLLRLRRELWQQCLLGSGSAVSTPTSANCATISPALGTNPVDSDLSALPLADRVLIAAADQVVALQVRSQGNLHALLKRRLSETSRPLGAVWLALGDQLVSAEVATELQSLGAVGWYLWPQDETAMENNHSADVVQQSEVHLLMPWSEGSYLVHWTRRRLGPWPDQSADDFIDELLLSRAEHSHSAFAALARIVRQRRLIASGLRGGFQAVSFSATGLTEFPQRRTFRRHRGRWDFELFGVCVRREWLATQGVRPVIYGDESDWPTLGESDRPFWQRRQSSSRGGAASIDWSVEAEWRVPQDVDLAQAPRDAVLLFAPSEADAQSLSAISPWPVVVLQQRS